MKLSDEVLFGADGAAEVPEVAGTSLNLETPASTAPPPKVFRCFYPKLKPHVETLAQIQQALKCNMPNEAPVVDAC